MLSLKKAEELVKKGAVIRITFMDSLYYTHEYFYSKEKFPDKTLRELLEFLKSFNNDTGLLLLWE